MKNTSHSSPTGSLLVGMAAGAALGAVGTMAATQNQRQVEGIALDVHKHRANYNDSHSVFLSCSDSDYLYCIGFAGRGQEQRSAKSTRSPKAPRAVGIRI